MVFDISLAQGLVQDEMQRDSHKCRVLNMSKQEYGGQIDLWLCVFCEAKKEYEI